MKFGITNALVLTSTNNEDRPDMEFVVHEKPENPDEFMDKFIERNPELKSVRKEITKVLFDKNTNPAVKFALFTPYFRQTSISSPETLSPNVYALEHFGDIRDIIVNEFSQKQREVIESASRRLKKDIEKIPESEARAILEERVKSIEGALLKIKRLEKLDEKVSSIEGEIRGIRTLVGVSEEFRDWRVLALDVSRLKEEHVPKEVFTSEITTLKERIDALSGLREAYDKVLALQSEVVRQQSSFVKWIKYATILLPIAVVSVPAIEIIGLLIRHYLGIG